MLIIRPMYFAGCIGSRFNFTLASTTNIAEFGAGVSGLLPLFGILGVGKFFNGHYMI